MPTKTLAYVCENCGNQRNGLGVGLKPVSNEFSENLEYRPGRFSQVISFACVCIRRIEETGFIRSIGKLPSYQWPAQEPAVKVAKVFKYDPWTIALASRPTTEKIAELPVDEFLLYLKTEKCGPASPAKGRKHYF